jgi:hypothetical protein
MIKIKKGQQWKSKVSGIVLTVIKRATGNKHWTVNTNRGKSHHIHEGTLRSKYEVVE